MTDERNTGRLVVIGANHRTSSEATRDRLFIEEERLPGLLREAADAGLSEAVLLSTCARTEIVGIAEEPDAAKPHVVGLLARLGGFDPAALEAELYDHRDDAAVRHVFRVASSLDSPIVGEPEVTGQFRDAVRIAAGCGRVGTQLDAVVQAANAAAKRVRTETAVGERSVSMAACAVQVARDVHGDLSRAAALLVTGGEMGEMIVDRLRDSGLERLTVAARSAPRAEIAARRYGCHHTVLDDLPDRLSKADIVVSTQGAGRYLFDPETVEAALVLRRRRPLLLVDAAIPCDVDPAVNDLDGAFVYSLDDLERIALEGRSQRDEAAAEAEALIEEELERFRRAGAERSAVPALSALRDRFEALRRDVLSDLGNADPAVDEATLRLVNRLLHDPSINLRDMAGRNDPALRDAERHIRRLFSLDGDEEKEK